MAYTTVKQCANCPKTFKANSNRQKYCKSCRPLVRVEKNKQWQSDYYYRNQNYMHEKSTKYNQSEKGKASEKLRSAVRSGKIVRQSCEVCGEPNAEGHHEDYSKPLEVRWLCRKHHAESHLREQWMIDLRKADYQGGFLLGELIEACGDKFDRLQRNDTSSGSKYSAYPVVDYLFNNKFYVNWAENPEEAVANLWLAINNK